MSFKVSESDFQQQIIDLAHLFGWRVAHFRSVRVLRKDGSYYYQTPVAADGEGFPDLVLVHPEYGWVIFAETKSLKGKVKPEQDRWIKTLSYCKGVETYIWRPTDKDWESIKNALLPINRTLRRYNKNDNK